MLEHGFLCEHERRRYYDDRALAELDRVLARLCLELAVTDQNERLNLAALLFEVGRVTEKPAHIYQLVHQLYATRH